MDSNSASRSASSKRSRGKTSPVYKLTSPEVSAGSQHKGHGIFSRKKAQNQAQQQEEIALFATCTYSTQTDILTDTQSNSTALTVTSAGTTRVRKKASSDDNHDNMESVTSLDGEGSATEGVAHKSKSNGSANSLPSFRSMYCRCHYFYDKHLKAIAKRYTALPENNPVFNELIMNCKLEYSKSWKGQILAYILILYVVMFVIVIAICLLMSFYLYSMLVSSFEVCNILPNIDYLFDAGKLLSIKRLPSPESISMVYGRFTGLGSVDVYHCSSPPGPMTNLDGTEEHRTLSYLVSFSSTVTSASFSLSGNGRPTAANLYANALVSRHFPFSDKICIRRTNNFKEPADDDNTAALSIAFEKCVTLQYILENRTTTDFRPIFYCDNVMGCKYDVYLQTQHKYRDMLLDLHIVLDFVDLSTQNCKYIGLTSAGSISPKPNNYLLIKHRNGSNLVRDTIALTFHYPEKVFVVAIIIMSIVAIAALVLFVYTLQIVQWRFYMRTIDKVLNDYMNNKRFRKEVMAAKSRL